MDGSEIQESKNSLTLEYDPKDFKAVYELFNSSAYTPSNAEVAYIPASSIILNADQFTKITKLIETLEELIDLARLSPSGANLQPLRPAHADVESNHSKFLTRSPA